jgi:hypothetical protein
MAGEMKRARKAVNVEMKDLKTLATARARALDAAIKELAKQGVKGVPRILSTHGKHFTPEERALLENATEEVVEKLIETRAMLKDLRSSLECI